MEHAIATHGLTKRFGAVTAVDGVSLTVARGEVYGFLGLNGAGKSTTIRMLLGMIRPTGGSATIAGQVIRQNHGPWARVGSLVEVPHAYPELSVFQNLEIFRKMHGLTAGAVSGVIEKLGLGQYAHRKAGTLSLGNKQRLGLARALIHDPEILLLDEPSNGLDPAGIVEVRKLLLDLVRSRGVTIFVSSHILAEVARIATRIGIIHQGRLVQEINALELHRLRQRRLMVRTRDVAATRAALNEAGYAPAPAADGALALTEESALERPEDVAGLLVRAGQSLVSLHVSEEDLESYFLRLIGAHGAVGP